MSLNDYELVVVFTPEIDEEQAAENMTRICTNIENGQGTIAHQETWGLRRLAYPIQRHTEGHYWLTRFKMEPSHAVGLESSLNLSEEIIRYLLVRD